MVRKLEEFKGDSYVVDVLPLGKTDTYPMIVIYKRKKMRPTGAVAIDKPTETFLKVSPRDFQPPNIDETARQIGRLILDDSEIVREYLGRRP